MRKPGYLQRILLLFFSLLLSGHIYANDIPTAYSPIPAVDCVINPSQVIDLASPVRGVIDQLLVERSQQVVAGQVMAQLDAQVERANVELASFRANIQSEIQLGEINMNFDSRRQNRVESLHREKVISDDIADEAQREANVSRWNLEQARELAEVRRLELQRAQAQLEQKYIRAPFNGYVLDTFKHPGEYVEDQPILRLAQLDPLVVEAIVPMESFGQVKVGMQAEVIPEVLTDRKFTGQVIVVDRMGDTASNTFGVRLAISNPDNAIPAGLKCLVKFFKQSDEQIEQQAARYRASLLAETSIQRNESNEFEMAGSQPEEFTQGGQSEMESAAIPTILDQQEPAVIEKPLEVAENQGSPRGYLVLMPQGETQELTRERIANLRKSGIHDLQEVDHGVNKGLIMLGFFSTPDRAEHHLQRLEDLGFSAFIREWY